jgi:hypothetical protein
MRKRLQAFDRKLAAERSRRRDEANEAMFNAVRRGESLLAVRERYAAWL